MNDSEFEAPPLIWAVLPIVGGVATAAGLILGLGWLGNRLSAPDNRSTNVFSEATYTAQGATPGEELPLA